MAEVEIPSILFDDDDIFSSRVPTQDNLDNLEAAWNCLPEGWLEKLHRMQAAKQKEEDPELQDPESCKDYSQEPLLLVPARPAFDPPKPPRNLPPQKPVANVRQLSPDWELSPDSATGEVFPPDIGPLAQQPRRASLPPLELQLEHRPT